MAFWDLLSSACIALTIVPMPRDVINVYDLPGKAYGTTSTCEIQGFFIMVGLSFAVCANCVLNMYYVCTIRYGISERNLNKVFLPIALVLSTLASVPVGAVPLWYGLLNPSPYEMYCVVGVYPDGCNKDDNVECIRGVVDRKTDEWVRLTMIVLIMCTFGFVAISLVVVVMTLFRFERNNILQMDPDMEAQQQREDPEEEHHSNDISSIADITKSERDSRTSKNKNVKMNEDKKFRLTNIAGRVALLYIAAFFITWIWTIISIVPIHLPQSVWHMIGYARSLFVPMQGFFNSSIFIYHKMYSLRTRASYNGGGHMPLFLAFKKVIRTPGDVPPDKIVSGLNMANREINARRQHEDMDEQHDNDDFQDHKGITNEQHHNVDFQNNLFSSSIDASKWDDFDSGGSKKTPIRTLSRVISETDMSKTDFQKEEDTNDFRNESTKRKYYTGVVTNLNSDASPGGLQHCVNDTGSKYPQLSTGSSDAQSSDMLSHDYTTGHDSMLSGLSSMLSGLGGKRKDAPSATNNYNK